MTVTRNGYPNTDEPQDIEPIETETESEFVDLVVKISQANALERSGKVSEAIALYQEVVEADPAGNLGTSARKALERLEVPAPKSLEEVLSNVQPETIDTATSFEVQKPQKQYRATRRAAYSPLQWFYNLPISRKQLIALLTAEILSLGLVALGVRWIITTGLRSQLLNQAKSEVAVTEANYNIKVNQMGFGFRGQSDNIAIVAAAKTHAQGQILNPVLQNQVEQILRNEVKARKIEYATLVGKDLRIIVNANANRKGEIFNPNNLVKEVLADPRQIKASAIAPWAELAKESPPLPLNFAKQDALIRYTVTPVRDPVSKVVIGVLVSGDIVNGKAPIVQETLKAFGGGYSAVYLRQPTGEFALATALDQGNATALDKAQPNVGLPDTSILEGVAKANGKLVTQRITIGAQTYTVAAKALPNLFKEAGNGSVPVASGEPVAILVRGTPETALNELLYQSLLQELGIFFLALLVIGSWALILRRAIVKPIEHLQQTAQEFSDGNEEARARVFATDEVGKLAMTFNEMADSINASARAMEKQGQLRQAEADFQRQEKERLQQGVINLLIDIEGAQQGDLTVKAKIDEGEMGSIADAFNTTISSLRKIVSQVKIAANQVHESAFSSEASVEKLAEEATTQAKVIAETLHSVGEMGQSIESVAVSAQEAAAIARQALVAAEDGDKTMDQTVSSMGNIRSSVAETSKKIKRLAESSQEISKIVGIISGISEKTNLLAFNASIEASRAGENGQGFRVVADEVRRLAERVTDSAKEIEQLISTIQQETAEVLQTMESSTQQVVTGTQLVAKTKETLQGLAGISREIHQAVQFISATTVSQAQASQQVNQTIQEVAAIAQSTSSESEAVSSSLQQLVEVAEELQSSVSRFQVEK
ncbi:MAG: methyl-accepting chemotaxis protein [Aphanothece sp. CMT-3BRIN-NPC111]|jgi:twitching motility protein PilJ|nr:methyl-accepting chemotaxis protein [Aphanothece sp. CMT-3BRIN-NPC111]